MEETIMKDSYAIPQESIRSILEKYRLGSISSFQEIKTGLINPVFIINNQFILKVNTKHTIENKQKFEKEAFLLTLFSKSDIPSPKLIGFGISGEIIKEDYLLMTYVEGETLTTAFENSDQETKDNLALQLGKVAREIHTIDIKEILLRPALFGLKENWVKTTNLDFATYFKLIKERKLLPDNIIGSIEEITHKFSELGDLSDKLCLIHGDFSPNNFQVKNGLIVGVFDFEMATLGDPLYDLQKYSISFQLGDEFDKNAFLEGYGFKVISEAEKIRLKRYSLSQGLWEMWATENQEFPFGDKEMKEGKNLIARTLDL